MKLSGETLLAISLYHKVIKTEKRAEKLRDKLYKLTPHIPDNEMGEYVEATSPRFELVEV